MEMILKSALRVFKYRLFNIKSPLSVIFSVTHKCNYNCKYCQVPQQDKKDLNIKQILLLIKQMKEAGTQRLGIQGGEPLLRKDIGEIINFAKQKGLFVTMGTNGSLLKKKINEIKNVDALITSYDGPSAHNIYRHKNSYKKMIDGIKIAVDNKIKVFNVSVLSKHSLNEIDTILQQANEFGFYNYFTPMMNLDTTGDTSSIIPSTMEYKKVIKKLIKLKKNKNKYILNSNSYLKYIYNWPDFSKTIINGEYNCYASKLFCHLSPNGYVFPCINLTHKVNGFNALKYGFKQAFQKSSRLNCRCSTFSFVELNNLFNLNVSSICNTLRVV